MTAAKLSLHAIATQALNDTDLAEPRDLADYIIDEVLDESDFEEALRIALPPYISEVIRVKRYQSRRNRTTTKTATTKAQRRRQSILHDRVYVGGQRILLYNATREDVEFIVADYKRRSGEELAMADRYTKLLGLFNKFKANAVRDLPLREVEKALA